MAMKYYCDNNGNYIGGFDGSEPPLGSIEVLQPPPDGTWYVYDKVQNKWVEKPGRVDGQAAAQVDAAFVVGLSARLMFEVNFNQENRIRTLEGKAIITRTQFRDALIALVKTL